MLPLLCRTGKERSRHTERRRREEIIDTRLRPLHDVTLQEILQPHIIQTEDHAQRIRRDILPHRLQLDDELHDELRRTHNGIHAHTVHEMQPATVVRAERHDRRTQHLKRILHVEQAAV